MRCGSRNGSTRKPNNEIIHLGLLTRVGRPKTSNRRPDMSKSKLVDDHIVGNEMVQLWLDSDKTFRVSQSLNGECFSENSKIPTYADAEKMFIAICEEINERCE